MKKLSICELAYLAIQGYESSDVFRDRASGAQTEEDIIAASLALAQRILEKSEQLYQVSAQISGRRTKLWNQVEAALTIEEVREIVW